MNKEPIKEKTMTKENVSKKETSGKKKTGNGIILGFQVVLAALLIGAVVLLKTTFPAEYEETKRRYYVLLNEEISFENIGRYVTNLFKAGDTSDVTAPSEFLSVAPDGSSSELPVSSGSTVASLPPSSQPESNVISSMPVVDEEDNGQIPLDELTGDEAGVGE